MFKLILEKHDNGMRVTMHDAEPSFVCDLSSDTPSFRMCLEAGGDSVVALLSSSSLQLLGWQCQELVRQLDEQQCTVARVEESYRSRARSLKALDDRSIRYVLYECPSDVLINFLWYMKDMELNMTMRRNMSAFAAKMLMDDLNVYWGGIDPDNAQLVLAKRGREAVDVMMDIVRRLIAESRIPDVLLSSQKYRLQKDA